MRSWQLLAVPVISFLMVGCATTQKHTMTPLEIQALQTREFDTNKQIAFASVVSVFQDLGYTIESADMASGLITAGSASDSKTDWFFTGNTYIARTRATAFVEEVGPRARVRLNFVLGNQTSSMYGQQSVRDKPILDADAYQNAFNRIEDAIFIRSGS